MAAWQRKLDVKAEWPLVKDGKITIQRLAEIVAERLAALRDFGDPDIDDERDDIVAEFAAFSRDEDSDVDGFEELYDRLCDWGDQSLDGKFNGRKVCWIATF